MSIESSKATTSVNASIASGDGSTHVDSDQSWNQLQEHASAFDVHLRDKFFTDLDVSVFCSASQEAGLDQSSLVHPFPSLPTDWGLAHAQVLLLGRKARCFDTMQWSNQ